MKISTLSPSLRYAVIVILSFVCTVALFKSVTSEASNSDREKAAIAERDREQQTGSQENAPSAIGSLKNTWQPALKVSRADECKLEPARTNYRSHKGGRDLYGCGR